MFSGTHFGSTTKSIIFNVWQFLKISRDANTNLLSFTTSDVDLQILASRIIGISGGSILNIVQYGLQTISSAKESYADLKPLPEIAYRIQLLDLDAAIYLKKKMHVTVSSTNK